MPDEATEHTDEATESEETTTEQPDETTDENTVDHATENADLRTVLQILVGEDVDLDTYLDDNLTYKRDGTPVFRLPQSKEAARSVPPKRSHLKAAAKQSTPKKQESTAKPSASERKAASERQFAEWQAE